MRLSAENISFGYSKSEWILKDIDFHVSSGEIVGLMAPSGRGKSTLAKLLAGHMAPQKGVIKLANQPLTNRGYSPVQLIFQHPEKAVNPLWKMRRVLEEARARDQELMRALGISEKWLDRWPGELSGGELQRFCVLRALNEKTRFIIADEMTTMLDPITQAQIWEAVVDFSRERHIGLVVISHDMPLLKRLCDRICQL